jgi:hypothetical protein
MRKICWAKKEKLSRKIKIMEIKFISILFKEKNEKYYLTTIIQIFEICSYYLLLAFSSNYVLLFDFFKFYHLIII